MLCMYMNRNRRNMHKMIYYPKGGMQMYMNTGYLNQSHQDFKDKRQPLVVGSCGCYRLSTYPKLPTYRPRGRLDYQIIYIASSEMDPVHLSLIFSIVFILLKFLRSKQHDIAGRDNRFIFWRIKMKVSDRKSTHLNSSHRT